MLKFNNNDIFTGYLKQLLSSFNLPTYYNGKWTGVDNNYYYNKRLLNGNRNYKITSNIYDSYTHEYLGEYLRFYRDWFKIDLMPMYNCFSNSICANINLNNNDIDKEHKKFSAEFKSADHNYKIYMVPVHSGKTYTIAIDCTTPIELCCGIYNKYQLNTKAYKNDEAKAQQTANIQELLAKTYCKKNYCNFSDPFIYSVPAADDKNNPLHSFLIKHEANLKLFIKLPATNISSIVVLEGNYLSYNDRLVKTNSVKTNHTVINFDAIDEYTEDFKTITNLELLRTCTSESYPFADRLLEYLLDNVITSNENIIDNIERVQQVMSQNYINGEPIQFDLQGIWDDKMRLIAYTSMQTDKNNKYSRNHDTLGFIDKDVEATYVSDKESLLNVDIYPDMYVDDK